MSRPSPSPPPGLCTCCPLCLAPATLTSAQLAPSCCSALISKVASSGSLSLITLLWLDLHCPALFLLKQFLFVDIMTSLIEITGRRSTNPCSILKSPFSGVERKSGLFWEHTEPESRSRHSQERLLFKLWTKVCGGGAGTGGSMILL